MVGSPPRACGCGGARRGQCPVAGTLPQDRGDDGGGAAARLATVVSGGDGGGGGDCRGGWGDAPSDAAPDQRGAAGGLQRAGRGKMISCDQKREQKRREDR